MPPSAASSLTHGAPRAPLGRQLFVIGLAVTPPVVWAAHLLLSYWFVPVSCRQGTSLSMHLTTFTAVAIIAGAFVLALRALGNGSTLPVRNLVMATSLDAEQQATNRALPRLAALLGLYFIGVVVITGAVALVVRPCA